MLKTKKTTRKSRIIPILTALAIFISIFTALNISAQTFYYETSGNGWHVGCVVYEDDEGEFVAAVYTLTVSSDVGVAFSQEAGMANWRAELSGWTTPRYITEVIIENTVTTIGDAAFLDIGAATIEIPDSVVFIGGGRTFNSDFLTAINVDPNNSHYSSLNGVLFSKDGTELRTYPEGKAEASYTVPNGVTSIYNQAFASAKNLTSIVISQSVEFIDFAAFANCVSLNSITFTSRTPPTFNEWAFSGAPPALTIHVPHGAKAAYAAIEGLSNFTIHELPAPAIRDNDDDNNNNRGGSSVRDTIISGGGIGGAAGSINSSGNSEINGHFENDTYIKHAETPLVYTADKNYADFREVRINGRRLTKGTHYTVKSGSTIITLLPEYLDALEAGEHELSVHFSGLAVVKASFIVENAEHDDVSTLAGILEDFDSISFPPKN
ncbi:MAG: leucine-rich repeat protein [Oscillospiraceae bacterium]|nr:leucine-rich repeat protein [Oscillospiraceae bacterium]